MNPLMTSGAALCHARFDSSMGTVIVTGHDAILHGLYFDGQKHQPDPSRWGPARPELPVFERARELFTRYLDGEPVVFDMPLEPIGTPFQRDVWRCLLAVERGSTITYGELSRRVGRPSAVRAVGAAVGRNPISVIVPCHRIVGSDGSLTGYAGGLDRKRELLRLEARRPSRR